MRWSRSRFSGSNNNCVEWLIMAEGVSIRDSKHPDSTTLFATHGEWRQLTAAVQANVVHPWVTVAADGAAVLSKEDGQLHFTRGEWTAFVDGVVAGEARAPLATA